MNTGELKDRAVHEVSRLCKRCGMEAVAAIFLGFCAACFGRVTREDREKVQQPES